MKKTKMALAIILALVMVCVCSVSIFAASAGYNKYTSGIPAACYSYGMGSATYTKSSLTASVTITGNNTNATNAKVYISQGGRILRTYNVPVDGKTYTIASWIGIAANQEVVYDCDVNGSYGSINTSLSTITQ